MDIPFPADIHLMGRGAVRTRATTLGLALAVWTYNAALLVHYLFA